MTRISTLFVIVVAALLAASCDSANDEDRRRVGRDAFIDVSHGESPLCGTLQIEFIESGVPAETGHRNATYTTAFQRSTEYSGMEDNDIRGYLDGSFKEGWNQVSQTHLRLGRRGRNPAYGELELFRNLQRWADLPLPDSAAVLDADVTLSLESGPPFAVDIAVYAVLKDWNPGSGGVNGDNNGPPEQGDAWWVDAKYGETPWSRAGAGHASDEDTDADTGAQPLAIARYEPDSTKRLVFSSERLTKYVDEKVHAGQPVLLLYKLTDQYEDSPGSVFEIWSANFGVDGSPGRPTLTIHWQSNDKVSANTFPLVLEPGRALEIQDIAVGGVRTVVSQFSPAPEMIGEGEIPACAQLPHLEYRPSNTASDWKPLVSPSTIDEARIDVRVSAASDPVPLGDSFAVEIRDTWVPNGAPEDHAVEWGLDSPDGRQMIITAEYVGDFTWRMSLATDAIGRWRYRWRHSLSGHLVESDIRYFDVVAWELPQVEDGLRSLQKAIETSGASPKTYEMLPFELSFMRLERAAMALQVDEATAAGLRLDLRKIRELLAGQPVPEIFTPKPIRSRTGGNGL